MKKIIILLLTSLILLTGCTNKEVNDDKTKFNEEYSLNLESNLFKYKNSQEILDAINNKDTFLLYVGNNENELSKSIINTLIDASYEYDLNTIYYVNNKEDNYNILVDYLNKDDETYILEVLHGEVTNYCEENNTDIINLAVKEVQETLATCNETC